jgi:hypothetical protein
LYSLSYGPNPGWSRVLPSDAEISTYVNHVAAKYDLLSKMAFNVDVERCQWREEVCKTILAHKKNDPKSSEGKLKSGGSPNKSSSEGLYCPKLCMGFSRLVIGISFAVSDKRDFA